MQQIFLKRGLDIPMDGSAAETIALRYSKLFQTISPALHLN